MRILSAKKAREMMLAYPEKMGSLEQLNDELKKLSSLGFCNIVISIDQDKIDKYLTTLQKAGYTAVTYKQDNEHLIEISWNQIMNKDREQLIRDLNIMRFYVIGYGTFEESEKLIVFTNEKLTKEELTNRVFKAVEDMLNEGEPKTVFEMLDFQEEEEDKESSLGKIGVRTQDVISDCLYPYLEKYNLKKVEMENQIWFWGWNDTEREELWTESDEVDGELIDLMKKIVNKKRGVK